jgi:hypothetical protein
MEVAIQQGLLQHVSTIAQVAEAASQELVLEQVMLVEFLGGGCCCACVAARQQFTPMASSGLGTRLELDAVCMLSVSMFVFPQHMCSHVSRKVLVSQQISANPWGQGFLGYGKPIYRV